MHERAMPPGLEELQGIHVEPNSDTAAPHMYTANYNQPARYNQAVALHTHY